MLGRCGVIVGLEAGRAGRAGRFDVTVEACMVGMTPDGRTGVTGRIAAAWAPKGRSCVLPCLGFQNPCVVSCPASWLAVRVYLIVCRQCRLISSWC